MLRKHGMLVKLIKMRVPAGIKISCVLLQQNCGTCTHIEDSMCQSVISLCHAITTKLGKSNCSILTVLSLLI